MTRRALIVGAQTGELAGVDHDVEVMSGLLDQREFEIRSCTGAEATRAGILAAYDQLILDTEPGDASFFYYSGHGGVVDPEAPADPAPAAEKLPDLQFIVPTDFAESSPTDFRGILAPELSVLLARLVAKSDNVVVMLDCCHAAHMTRDEELRPRALARRSYFDVARHVQRQIAAGLEVDLLRPLGNQSAVRLVACAPDQSAYEYPNRQGIPAGIFTESLQIALEEAGSLPVTWSTVMRRVRDRVLALSPTQRPEVEGAASARLLFDTRRAEHVDAVPIITVPGGRAAIPGGRLLGITVDDTFAIMPPGAAMIDEASLVGTATVDRIAGAVAQTTVEFQPGHDRIPLGAQGFPTRTARARRAVALGGDGPELARLRATVDAASLVRPAEPDDDTVLATVEATADGLVIRDSAGPLTYPVAAGAVGAERVAVDLQKLARAENLRALDPEPGADLTDPFTVEWGRVIGGTALPFTSPDELVHVGESLYIRLRNDSDRRLYFFVFDIGVSSLVQLLTDSDPGGLPLSPGEEYVIGQGEFGGLEGLPLRWPDSVPADQPRREGILVIATPAPQDLSVLEQQAIGDQARAVVDQISRSGSPLEQILAQTVLGGTREFERRTKRPMIRYAVRHLDLLLSAAPAPTREVAPFLIDERPSESVRLLAGRRRTVAGPPARVAVRLDSLTVHRNRAMFGADVRVDALVLTAGDGDQPVYRAETARFSNIRDGDRLPLENMLVYHGPAVDYLDFAWWVSRDRTDSLSLSDMLQQRLTAQDFAAGLGQLAGLALAAPQAVAAAAAVGAAAVVVNTAYALLSKAVGDSIGLYRTSFLADEDFGSGRQPRSGVLTAQGFSFSYHIQRMP